MSGLLHAEHVQRLVDAGCKTGGFGKEIRGIEEGSVTTTLRPDAYRIDKDTQTIRVYEVEVSHPLNDSRLLEYGRVHGILDFYGWNLELYLIDRYGQEHARELVGWYYQWVLGAGRLAA